MNPDNSGPDGNLGSVVSPPKHLRHVDRGRNRISTCAFADTVAREAITKYRALVPDWEKSQHQTVLAAILLLHSSREGEVTRLEVVAVGVGTKYMSTKAIAASEEFSSRPGGVLRDCHAEVLARRAFRLYLAREMQGGDRSTIFAEHHEENANGNKRWRRLQDSVSVHMYTSSMPCGNACVRKWANGRREVQDESIGPMQCPVQRHPTFSAHARADGQIAPMWKKDEVDGVGLGPRSTSDEWCPAGVTLVMACGAVKCEEKEKQSRSNKIEQQCIPPAPASQENGCGPSPTPSEHLVQGLPNPNPPNPATTTTPRRLLSCSDKIARWNVLGLQGKHLARCTLPVYLASITIGRKFNRPHAERALCCRLEACRPAQLGRDANDRNPDPRTRTQTQTHMPEPSPAYPNPNPDPHTGTQTHIPEPRPRPTYPNPNPKPHAGTQTHIPEPGPRPTYPNPDPDPHTGTQTHIPEPRPTYRVNHPAVMCTAVKLDERAIEAETNVQFADEGCMWWSKALDDEADNEPEWVHGPSGKTADGQESVLSTCSLAAEEELSCKMMMMLIGCKGGISSPQGGLSAHSERIVGDTGYDAAKQWLYRKGGLFGPCNKR